MPEERISPSRHFDAVSWVLRPPQPSEDPGETGCPKVSIGPPVHEFVEVVQAHRWIDTVLTPEAIDAAAEALYTHNWPSHVSTPWERLTNGRQRDFREWAEKVLRAVVEGSGGSR